MSARLKQYWDGIPVRSSTDPIRKYRIQVDAAFPSVAAPQTVVSVTYTNPDTRGHSNENKLQLKVGELALLKGAFPNVRTVLAIGGSGQAWLGYVLRAFKVFFDEVLFLWEERDRLRLKEIGEKPVSVPLRHTKFWKALHADRQRRVLCVDETTVPCGAIRYAVLDRLKAQKPVVHNPTLIENEIAALCMRRSFDLGGAEWKNYLIENWGSIEMSRNYFNPVEASVELTLRHARLKFEGGIARDVRVPSLLHDLGMNETIVSEDFVLFSRKLNQPVFIQCKASGGGRHQHGKNIQNRTKEQTASFFLYSAKSPDGAELIWKGKAFHWIGVLDGDWAVTGSAPLKYVHMLELAGYDKIFCAADLVTKNLQVRRADNPLQKYLIEILDCEPQ